MRLRWSDVLSLTSVLAVLWSLAWGRPGHTCSDEWPNAQNIAGRLMNYLENLHKLLLQEGFQDGGKRSLPIFIPRSNETSDSAVLLDTISTHLCQYHGCLGYLVNSSWWSKQSTQTTLITSKMSICQHELSKLRNTILKMKQRPAAQSPSPCEVACPFAGTGWKAIAAGPQLSKELLEYLKELQSPCG